MPVPSRDCQRGRWGGVGVFFVIVLFRLLVRANKLPLVEVFINAAHGQ
jgi:hypothetical protein